MASSKTKAAAAKKKVEPVKAAARKKAAVPTKPAVKKAVAKKAAVKKAVAKKPGAGKAAAKATVKKAAPAKAAVRKAAVETPSAKALPQKPASKKPAAGKPVVAKAAARKPSGVATRAAAARRRGAAAEDLARRSVAGLSEEDQIRAAKYLPRELPKKVFEEERFLFPESYGVNRVRLLVRDPEWIFAYWDVSATAMKDLGRSLGERALALSRLTLRVIDPVSGGSSDILLPPGARWWYVRTDSARRTYRAELGVILPSGEFRRLAESNTVVTPRVGPSAERARRRMSYRDARELPPAAAAAAGIAEQERGVAHAPWDAASVDGAAEPGPGETERATRGGASDAFRPGGASDTFRR
jgi:hypothetical protein